MVPLKTETAEKYQLNHTQKFYNLHFLNQMELECKW